MALDKAVREYKARNLPKALAVANKSLGRQSSEDPGLLALIGKIQFELGNRREAADAFSKAADGAGNGAGSSASLYKIAVSLYRAISADKDVMRIGPRAVELNPGDADFAYSVAEVMFNNGALEAMQPLLERLDRSRDEHLALIINHHRLSRRYGELAALLSTELATKPDNAFLRSIAYTIARETCDFDTMAEHAALMANPESPLAAAVLARDAALSRLTWCDDDALNARPSLESNAAAVSLPPKGTPRLPISPAGKKLRIGYLSGDFFEHATMTLFRDAMLRHDRSRFEIKLFCYSPPAAIHHQQAWPKTLRDAVVRVGPLTDAQAAQRIDAEAIDILVDLKGHTLGARPAIVNLSHAAVKVTYLGYPGTVGGVDLDYAITDRIVTPDSARAHFSEKLCRLPESYQANSFESRPLPGRAKRADHGLPKGAFVYASFNATHKINGPTLDIWTRVLRAVPDAVFWCMCPSEHAAENLLSALEARGVARSRVVIAGLVEYPAHLARLQLADLALDTWPYNGHTTTADMLWAGLPVLAKNGGSFASRVSASLLTALGVDELVASDDEAYVALAVELSKNRERLTELRRLIAVARDSAPLFDAERFTRHLEKAYEMMAERVRARLAPDHLDVPALPPRTESFATHPDAVSEGFAG